jgi:hypothetical protein
MLRPPCLKAVVIKFPFRVFQPVLLWFRVIVMMRFLFRVLCFRVPLALPFPLFALPLPHRLVALASALLGMVNIDLLLHLLVLQIDASESTFDILIAPMATCAQTPAVLSSRWAHPLTAPGSARVVCGSRWDSERRGVWSRAGMESSGAVAGWGAARLGAGGAMPLD